MLQHDNVPVHKVKSIKKGFTESAVEELDWLDAFVSEWEQIPVALLQHVAESLESQQGGSNVCVCLFYFYIVEQKHITGVGNEMYDQPHLCLLRNDILMTLNINFNTFTLPSHQILKENCVHASVKICPSVRGVRHDDFQLWTIQISPQSDFGEIS